MKDDAVQSEKVIELIEQYEDSGDHILILNSVIFESIWVLTSLYTIPESKIIAMFKLMLNITVFKFENRND